jgi:hypothetical protein
LARGVGGVEHAQHALDVTVHVTHEVAALAQHYSDNLRSEVLKGMDEKVRQGWPTDLAPFGYINVDDHNEPV